MDHLITQVHVDERTAGLVELTPLDSLVAQTKLYPALKDTSRYHALMARLGIPSEPEDIIYQAKFPRNVNPPVTTIAGHSGRYPFIIHRDKTCRLYMLTLPAVLDKHWLLGTYYGYPQCCIVEHCQDVQVFVDSGFKDNPVKAKKQRILETQMDNAGVMPCQQCLDRPPRGLRATIQAHRCCPTTDEPPGLTGWFGAVLAYLDGTLQPWSVHPVSTDGA